jgi:hypothetical protein
MIRFILGCEMKKRQRWQWIPTNLTQEQFAEFVLPYLSTGRRG